MTMAMAKSTSLPRARSAAMVKCMFGSEQLTAMADFVQGSLMLRYNKRTVG